MGQSSPTGKCPGPYQRLPLSERLKAPDSHLKRRILALRTQAMALAVDGMTGGKPMDFSRFIHENIAVHYVPEDEGKSKLARRCTWPGNWKPLRPPASATTCWSCHSP